MRNNKQIAIVILCGTLLGLSRTFAQTQFSTRITHNGAAVEVFRRPTVWSGEDLYSHKVRALDEVEFLMAYPEVEIIQPQNAYNFWRNCFDFAWAPYMSCMCNPPPTGGQTEAWWMEDPSANWTDGSMVSVVTSAAVGIEPPQADYLFNTEDLDALPNLYFDDLLEMIGLPVADLGGPFPPAHSAILVDWVHSVFAEGYSTGVFVSKWGQLGLYRHRWGIGLVPPIYCYSPTLQIFAPRHGWNPPYLIYHTPW